MAQEILQQTADFTMAWTKFQLFGGCRCDLNKVIGNAVAYEPLFYSPEGSAARSGRELSAAEAALMSAGLDKATQMGHAQ